LSFTPTTTGHGRYVGCRGIAGLGSMPPTPSRARKPVDHRGVRVGAEERVRHRDAVAHDDDLREPLRGSLGGRSRRRVGRRGMFEGLARPAEERVALAVALVLALEIALVDVLRPEEVGLDGVVDDQVDRDEGFDLRRVLACPLQSPRASGEIDGSGDAV